MTAESKDVTTDLRAILSELYPYRCFDHTEFCDHLLAAVVLLRREMMIRKYPPAYAEGTEPRLTALPKRGRKKRPY